MLVERTIHQGLRVLGDIYGVNQELSGTLLVGLSLQVDTTAWIKGDTTIGDPGINTVTLNVYGLINIPAGGFTTGIVMEKALDIDIGANTEFDINDDLFRFSDATNTLRVDSSNGIQLLGQTGVGATGSASYKLLATPDENQIGIGSINNYAYGPLEDGWAGNPNASVRITRDTSKYGLSDYSAIALWAKPTSPHTAQGMFGVYSATPANHHSGLFMAAYSGKWMTIFKGSMFGDFHFQTEYDRDVVLNFSQMATNGFPAVALIRAIIGFDDSSDSFKLEYGTTFTSSPAIEIGNDNVALINGVNLGVTETYTDVSSVSVGRTVDYDIPLCNFFLIDVSVDVENSDTDYNFNLINFETAGVSRFLYIDMRLSGEGRTTFDVQVKVRAGTLGTLLLNETVTNPEADKYWTLSLFYNGDTGYWSTLIDAATVRTT